MLNAFLLFLRHFLLAWLYSRRYSSFESNSIEIENVTGEAISIRDIHFSSMSFYISIAFRQKLGNPGWSTRDDTGPS